jgi:hypothetical protein
MEKENHMPSTTNYKLQITKCPSGEWTAVLYQKARTPLELTAPDVRTLLTQIAEVVVYRDGSPLHSRAEEVSIASGGPRRVQGGN